MRFESSAYIGMISLLPHFGHLRTSLSPVPNNMAAAMPRATKTRIPYQNPLVTPITIANMTIAIHTMILIAGNTVASSRHMNIVASAPNMIAIRVPISRLCYAFSFPDDSVSLTVASFFLNAEAMPLKIPDIINHRSLKIPRNIQPKNWKKVFMRNPMRSSSFAISLSLVKS